jgi:ABC-type dipeptide/oligopeptide/nickel transport system permease subunit
MTARPSRESVASVLDVARSPRGDVARRFATVKRFFRDPKAAIGAFLIAGFIVLAVGAPVIAPYGENELNPRLGVETPSWSHPLGTDRVGRDVLSRVIFGARTSLSVGLIAVGVACAIGVPLGLVSGWASSWLDEILMRFVDAWITLPNLLLVMALVAILGPGITNVMIAIGLGTFPVFARLIRGQTLSVKERDFVLAARALGGTDARILRSHVLPNAIQPVIVQGSLLMGSAILAEAGLSFLGIGLKPPKATWGVVIQEGYPILRLNPWMVIAPGIAISIFVLAVNLIGDRLRDVLDPRLRGRVR